MEPDVSGGSGLDHLPRGPPVRFRVFCLVGVSTDSHLPGPQRGGEEADGGLGVVRRLGSELSEVRGEVRDDFEAPRQKPPAEGGSFKLRAGVEGWDEIFFDGGWFGFSVG